MTIEILCTVQRTPYNAPSHGIQGGPKLVEPKQFCVQLLIILSAVVSKAASDLKRWS